MTRYAILQTLPSFFFLFLDLSLNFKFSFVTLMHLASYRDVGLTRVFHTVPCMKRQERL